MKTRLLFIIAATMLLFGCKKYTDYSAIKFEITNEKWSVLTGTTATLNADYSWPGKTVSIAMEVSEDEGLANAKSFEAAVSGNAFTVTATGLKAETTYYYRIKTDTGYGTVGSDKKTFTTTEYVLPAISTSEVANICGTKAECGGNVTYEGDFAVTARGVCWSTTNNPSVNDSHTVDGSGAGAFTSSITGLTETTTYYVRAYATSSAGTSYGEVRTFTTKTILPTVSTSGVTNICSTKADCGGNVTYEGDFAVTARGICWSTTNNPTVNDSHTVVGSGAGAFSSSITGLTGNTTYYVRAYATSSAGTSYGEERTFTTTEYVLPTVSTSGVTNICGTKAECGGNVTYEGDFAVTARGVCWSTTNNPTVNDSHTVDGSGAGAFSSRITGLTETTTYYVRAYATSSAGTSYGEVRTFTTTEYILPTVTTSEITSYSSTTAMCGGNVASEGDFPVTARGVCWSITDNPTVDDSHTADGSGAGAFSSSITGLTENTTYYVRAYATSSEGTVYGETRTFETNSPNEFTVNGVTFDMVYVEGGTFDMGATPEQGDLAWDNEYPMHSVTLDGYYIGKYEVTQELWEAVMGSNPSSNVGAQNPVERVNYNDCQEFISRLNSLTGKNFRLPTEAEWEYAARGGNQSCHYKYSGSNNIDDVAWYEGNSGSNTHPVGTKSPNELGIYDMSGNVLEWCSDWFGSYGSGAQTNPQGPSSGSRRVRRGGCKTYYPRDCRVSSRFSGDPSEIYYNPGLRLVLVP